MKKMILLASALALGGVAYAQDTAPAPTAQPGMTAPDSSAPPADPGMAPASPDASAPAPAPADPSAPAPTDPAAQPGMGAPAPADPSMGGGAQPGMATGPKGPVSMTPTQGATDLPACSKSVTDNCKQGGKGGGSHKGRRKHR